MWFEVASSRIRVHSVHTGYRPRELALNQAPELDVARAFVAAFPG